MFFASNSIIAPAFSTARPIGRALVHWLGERTPAALFLLACTGALVVYDIVTRKRIHPATLVGIAVFFLSGMVMGFLAVGSGLGAAFVEWLR